MNAQVEKISKKFQKFELEKASDFKLKTRQRENAYIQNNWMETLQSSKAVLLLNCCDTAAVKIW